ncbi:unnamed protein product [Aphanomyces euteiches]
MKEQIQKQFFESQSPEGQLDDGTPTDETFVRITVETTTSATQTEVDDDGLWDIKVAVNDKFPDLWSRTVYRSAYPKTRGFECTGGGLMPLSSVRTATDGPRLQTSIKRRIEDIYDAKLVADCSDEDDGIAYEDLNQFVASFYLKICSGRQKAEIKLYRLLISVKSLYRGSSMIRMFARFMHLLQPLPPTITPAAHPPVMADNADDDKDDKDKKKATMSKREMDCVGLSKQSYLNQSYLRVYLHARYDKLLAGVDYSVDTEHFTIRLQEQVISFVSTMSRNGFL